MQTTTNTGKRVVMIVGDFVEDYECFVPMQMMMMMNMQVDVISPDKKKGDHVMTAVHDMEDMQTYTEKKGHKMMMTMDWNSFKMENYDGLILPGGRSPEFLRMNTKVMDIVKYFVSKNKPIAAICHGIQFLTPTGMMKGRTMTCYPTVGPEVEMCGATYKKMEMDEAMVDGNIVTCPAWPGIYRWMGMFIKMLGMTNM